MNHIYTIDKVRLMAFKDEKIKVCYKARNGKWLPLYEGQGTMDGACAVYSTVMCMRIEGLLKSGNIMNQDTGFTRYFYRNKGMHVDGNEFSQLVTQLNRLSNGEYKAHRECAYTEKREYAQFAETILSNKPVILGIDWKGGGGYALLGVGYEEDADGNITKVYCLDPYYPEPQNAIWNAIIEIPTEKTSKMFAETHISSDGRQECNLDDYIFFERLSATQH